MIYAFPCYDRTHVTIQGCFSETTTSQLWKPTPLLAHLWVLQDISLFLSADLKHVSMVFQRFYQLLRSSTQCRENHIGSSMLNSLQMLCYLDTYMDGIWYQCSNLYAKWVKSTNHCRWKGSVHIAARIPAFHHFWSSKWLFHGKIVSLIHILSFRSTTLTQKNKKGDVSEIIFSSVLISRRYNQPARRV